jgi:hypothetical protein
VRETAAPELAGHVGVSPTPPLASPLAQAIAHFIPSSPPFATSAAQRAMHIPHRRFVAINSFNTESAPLVPPKSTAINPLVSSSTVHTDAAAAAVAAAVDTGCEAQPMAHEVASDADAQLIKHAPHVGLDAITAVTAAAGPPGLVATSISSAIEHAAAITRVWHR